MDICILCKYVRKTNQIKFEERREICFNNFNFNSYFEQKDTFEYIFFKDIMHRKKSDSCPIAGIAVGNHKL